jgi:hypothetical protein
VKRGGSRLVDELGNRYHADSERLGITGWGIGKLTLMDGRAQPQVSSNCPTPFSERTDPEFPIVLSRHQVPTQIEQI